MTQITCRPYRGTGFDGDFAAVREFLLRINDGPPPMASPEFPWARWEWAFCLPYLDREHLDRVGVWEADGQVVALATLESGLGEAYLAVDPRFRDQLLADMVDHAVAQLHDGTGIGIPVGDDELDLAALLAARGFTRDERTEDMAARGLASLPDYALPDGYTITSLAEGVDLHRFNRCLHLGFGHGEPVPDDDETIRWRALSTSAPSLIPELNTIVVAPDGDYAAYCGIFYDPATDYLLVEPVCTAPAHRQRGCARAAILESLHRAARLGARTAYVGSDQRLYQQLGFTPSHRSHWWTAPAG